MAEQKNSLMGITSLIGWLFGADAAAAPDATKLDGTTEVALARSLSALSPDERGWIRFAEARILFSYAIRPHRRDIRLVMPARG
jgi:hypothetical protein